MQPDSIHGRSFDLLNWWRYRLDRRLAYLEITPGQIVALYLAFGFGALFVSDVLLVQYIADGELLRQVQAVKGGVEIVLTAGLIFVLTRQSHRSLDRLNGRLKQQQEELTVLHRVLRHNLRNDTNVFRGYADLIRDEIERTHLKARCDAIITIADDIIHYIEQASKIGDVAAKNGNWAAVDLTDLVQRVLDNNPHVSDGIDVSLSLPPRARVHANHMIEAAIDELITNAIVHNDADAPTIEVRVDPTAGPVPYTTLAITDNGPGIPDEERLTLRKRREVQLSHSSGMGLWFVHWTVEMSDGRYTIADADPRGTTVRLLLPTLPD